MTNRLGVNNYECFDPGRNDQETNEAKIGYLTVNILPLVSNLPKSSLILEIGPGKGSLLFLLKQNGFQQVKGFEVSQEYAKELVDMGYDIHERSSTSKDFLEFFKGKIDALILIDVLEHLTKEEAYELLRTASACLKPQGRLILQLPNMSGLYGANTFYADFTHVCGYNELSLKSLLEACGFTKCEVFPLLLPKGKANLLRSLGRSVVFAFHRFMMKLVGATPIKVLTHNMVAICNPAA